MYVYEKDICSMIKIRLLNEVENDGGVKGYRLKKNKDVFEDVEKKKEND